MDSTIKIEFQGPFKLMATDMTSIFSRRLAFEKGIYLFTFPNIKNNSVHYVGMTAKGFGQRLSQHLGNYLIGGYSIHDPGFFVNGANMGGFKGWMFFSQKDGKREQGKKEYELKCEQGLGLQMLKFLDAMDIYAAPVDEGEMTKESFSRTLERMEAEIALYLNEQPGQTGEESEMVRKFQGSGVQYRPTRKDDDAFTFTIENNEQFAGMKKQFEAKWIEGRKSKLK